MTNNRLLPDTALIKELADILQETGLSEIEYVVDSHKIRIVKNNSVSVNYAEAPLPQIIDHAQQNENDDSTSGIDEDHPGLIKSPMVGNVFLSPSPEALKFTKVGDQITTGDTLLIIEAMKVMNPIKATKSGIVKEIFVKNNEPIEFAQPLAIIE